MCSKVGMNKGYWEPKIVNWPSLEGSPMPLGVTYIPDERAYNFALYSKNATEVTLLLFNEENHAQPIVEVWLEPLAHKTQRVWHCRLTEHDLHEACHYAYRVDGPKDNGENPRNAFDREKLLLDPYAKGVYFPPNFSREAAKRHGANAGQAPLGIFRFHTPDFDWKEDKSPLHFSDAII